MSDLPCSDAELAIAELARRVLPAGSFGNLPADIVIREGRGGYLSSQTVSRRVTS